MVVQVSASSAGYGTASAMLAQQVFASAAAFGGSTASAFAQAAILPDEELALSSLFVTSLGIRSYAQVGIALKSGFGQLGTGNSEMKTQVLVQSKFSEI